MSPAVILLASIPEKLLMASYAAVANEEDPCPPVGSFDRSSSLVTETYLNGCDLLDYDARIPEHLRHQATRICILGLRVGISLALFCVSVFMCPHQPRCPSAPLICRCRLFAAHHSLDTENNGAKASDYLANEYFPLFRYHWYTHTRENCNLAHC